MRNAFGQKMLLCKLLEASKGSVVTITELVFNGTKMESEVLGTLANATVNGTLGKLLLKASAGFNASAQIDVDDVCASKPCENDGKCIAKNNGYTCDCKLFRFGEQCQEGKPVFLESYYFKIQHERMLSLIDRGKK
ncbi:fibropellin-1 [Exaiptasia diaphana]|uniref:EGF-like domain-containing protein n=1 Tax=Exaiptasia diaphana TaxID=2652724 RepID=A0A913XM76_EXADI|nr:fibropellin-1 [Exaiptasia diaphana]